MGSVHATRAEAEAELLEYVRRNWSSEMGTEPPEAPSDMIAEYFSEVAEVYTISDSV